MQAPLLAGKGGSWPYLLPIAKSFDHVPALLPPFPRSFAQVPCQEGTALKCGARACLPAESAAAQKGPQKMLHPHPPI